MHETAASTGRGCWVQILAGRGRFPLQEDPFLLVEVQHGVAPPEVASRHPRCRQAVEDKDDYITIIITNTGSTNTTTYM